MLRNYLAAALRNMVRNRLYAAINIVGLAVGLTAALLVTLFVRDELSYDRWIPGYQRSYLITQVRSDMFRVPVRIDGLFFDIREALTSALPSVEAVARVDGNVYGFRHGEVEAMEEIWWSEPALLQVLPLPVYAGDAAAALARPDGMVITRAVARKYFGRDDVVGETLEVRRSFPMTILAVLEDLPPNSHFQPSAILSARASFAPAQTETIMKSIGTYYVRVKPGTSDQQFRKDFDAFLAAQKNPDLVGEPGKPVQPELLALPDVHFSGLFNRGPKANGSKAAVVGAAAVGFLTLLVAAINFINLMTAWAARRAAEVGVRKVSGAERRHLIVQFTGEALLYVLISTAAALLLTWILSPALQTFLQRAEALPYLGETSFLAGIALFAVALAVLAGAYPAFVLSAFRPARILGAQGASNAGSVGLRRLLTTIQFAVLIGLTLGVLTVHHQLRFALDQALRLSIDKVLTVDSHCRDAFKDQVRALPGVRDVACSEARALTTGTFLGSPLILRDGSKVSLTKTSVGEGFFDFYGVRPLAGRLLPIRPGDEMPYVAEAKDRGQPSLIVINETGIKTLGFESAAAAVGQAVTIPADNKTYQAEIVGVVPDFNLDTVGKAIPATYYYADPSFYTGLSVRLTGQDIPETLTAIDRLWKEFGEPKPVMRRFLDGQVQQLVSDMVRQRQVFAGLAAVAVFIACLGLFGLSAFTAELRTKEIGVRKAMGAGQGDILRMLVWEFAKPVLWANAIAWPIGYVLMRRWLEGFAHHVDLAPWMFLAASGAALGIAILTVIGHALMVARAEPVSALRYE